MIKKKKCNLCKKRFHPSLEGRLEMVKKLEKGKVEVWICPDCFPQVSDRLKDLDLLF